MMGVVIAFLSFPAAGQPVADSPHMVSAFQRRGLCVLKPSGERVHPRRSGILLVFPGRGGNVPPVFAPAPSVVMVVRSALQVKPCRTLYFAQSQHRLRDSSFGNLSEALIVHRSCRVRDAF